MWNIVIGVLMIIAGLSGQFALVFTDSRWPLIALGAAIAVWGVYQVSTSHTR